MLFKVQAAPERRNEVIEIANVFRAKIVDVGQKHAHHRGHRRPRASSKGMEDLFRAYGIKEIVRTGKIAMSRSMQ